MAIKRYGTGKKSVQSATTVEDSSDSEGGASNENPKFGKPRPTVLESADEDDVESSDGEAQELQEAEADSQGYWEALEILDEAGSTYYIRWAGVDENGKPWAPTWEPKSNANASLIAAWKKEGRQKARHRKEAAKLAKKLERKEEKRAKEKAKKKKAKGKKILRMKQDSPDPQPAIQKEDSNVEGSLNNIPRDGSRRLVVPDSESSSQDLAGERQSQAKKQQSDSRPAKQVTFHLANSSSPLTTLASSIGSQCPRVQADTIQHNVHSQSAADVEEELVRPDTAPITSSDESAASVIPDSQPAPAKALETSSSQLRATSEDRPVVQVHRQCRSTSPPIAHSIVAPSQSQSFPSFDSPGTNHSDLDCDLSPRGDDDVAIFNDPSQHDDDGEEDEYEEAQREELLPQDNSSLRTTDAAAAHSFGRVPIPPAAAFFPLASQPESSQLDPIEDPDSSPLRPLNHHMQQRSAFELGSPRRPAMAKTRLELTMGPPDDEDQEEERDDSPFQACLPTSELRMIANQALAYVTSSVISSPRDTIETLRSMPRIGSNSQLLKRAAARPVIAPISIQADFEGGAGVGVAVVTVTSQPIVPEVDQPGADSEIELAEEEDDDFSPGGFNRDYLVSDLIATQAPATVDFDDVVDYEKAVAGNLIAELSREQTSVESQVEAVDGGEGGSNSGGNHYSSYSSSHPPQQHEQQFAQPYHSQIPGNSMAATGYVGSGGAPLGGPGGPGGGGYPYPSHLQSAHQQQQTYSGKREHEDDREESAKKARMEQHRQQQEQDFYHQQQQQRHPQAQNYAQQPHHHHPSQGYPSYPPSQGSAYPSYGGSSASSQQAATYQQPHQLSPYQQHTQQHYHQGYSQQYQQLPPMQTSPPPVQPYSRTPSQLPPIAHALTNEGYTQQPASTISATNAPPPAQPPAPTVSVATASPTRPRSPPSQQTAQAVANSGLLTSPSISRVQNAEASMISTVTAIRPPSPLPQGANVGRTSSPAPNLEGVNDLIELVRASTQIEGSDGTKEEVVRFLRNPRVYGEGPLSRADFWAFELRRQVLDVGERVDFIILYTREGTFKLKRSPTTTIPVEFARSLNHAPDRVRGQTPAVDAVLTLSASSAGPSPLSVSAMTREQLEQEVTALRSQVSTASTELAALRPLVEETAKLRTEVQTLTVSNKQLKNSRDSAQQDMAYIQEQYSIASTAASARAQEASIAEAEAARLQGLLDAGLKQKAAFYEAGVKRWKLEVERMKKQVELVKVERRKMNELGVREKAGKWDEVVARRQHKLEKLERSKSGAAEGEPDEEDEAVDSEEEVVSNLLLGDRPKSQTPPAVPSIIKLVPDPTTESSQPATPSDPSSSALTEGTNGAIGYRCEWRGETQYDSQAQPSSKTCGLLLPSQAALLEHAVSHVTN